MLPEDPRELLRLYARAKGPHDFARERNLRRTLARLAAGDMGPALPAAGKAAALYVAARLASVVALVSLAGGGSVWLARSPAPPVADDGAGAAGGSGPARPPRSPGRAITAEPTGESCRTLARYTDPDQLRAAPDDPRAAFLQPWRGWLETVPALAFTDGVGAMVNLHELRGADPEPVVALLARHGVRHLLTELGWGHLGYDDERIDPAVARRVTAFLAACRRHGIRPTLRVVSHESLPCPERRLRRRLTAPARAGDRALVLDDTRDLVVGRSGISRRFRDVAAEILFTDVRGTTVSLSKPLPHDLPAGTTLSLSVLRYRPFAPPGTTDFADTLGGWLRYLDQVAELAVRGLGTADAEDKGFDLELWNSPHFASSFLFLGRYYDPPGPAAGDERAARQLAIETARHLRAHPARFGGVRLINGLVTHQRGEPCVGQPPPFAGIRRATPGAVARPLLQAEDGRVSETLLWPGVRLDHVRALAFPEIEATPLVPESFVQDLAPPAEGTRPSSCGVWVSGAGIEPRVIAPLASVERAQELKAKLVLRQYSFFLGKGARRMVVSATPSVGDTDDRGAGLIPLAFLRQGREGGGGDGVSPALAALGRLATATGEGAGPLAEARPLALRAVSDCHDHVQFRGGPGDPVLYNRDVFVFLPFQVRDGRFAVHYYVMTRDVTADLQPERYTLTIDGLPRARVRAYDPLRDRPLEAHLERALDGELAVTVEATDYPRVLLIDER